MKFTFNTSSKYESEVLGEKLYEYNLTEQDKSEIIEYLSSCAEQIKKSLADENWGDWSFIEPTTENAKNFVAEICDFTIGWKYDELDIVDLDERIIKQLKELA